MDKSRIVGGNGNTSKIAVMLRFPKGYIATNVTILLPYELKLNCNEYEITVDNDGG